MTVRVLVGDCRERLGELANQSVQCCVTSPPYFGLRDYGVDGQMGLEPTPDEYVSRMVEVFREVKRVLRDDGILWLNIGDSYAMNGLPGGNPSRHGGELRSQAKKRSVPDGIKAKDLIGIPWMLAFALRTDGWYLRQDIIWSKPNPMPESVTDRCTKSHEYIFLLSKSARYYYDAAAIAEPVIHAGTIVVNSGGKNAQIGVFGQTRGGFMKDAGVSVGDTRNKRSVWEVATHSFAEAHFATFPTDLIEPCILAGCPVGGTILDPFGGAGTSGLVADRLQRNAILIELNPEYAEMAQRRINRDAGMFAEVQVA